MSKNRINTHVRPRKGFVLGPADDRFVLVDEIHTSKVAGVWKAKHLKESKASGKDAFYVLKLLHENIAMNSYNYKRMENEANIAQSLRHPNIVATYGIRNSPCGNAFLVMNYLQGNDFQQLLEKHISQTNQGGLSWERIMKLMTPVADALNYTHTKRSEKGVIIHRDIKLENLFLTDSGEVYILDFGVSEKLYEAGTEKIKSDIDDGVVAYWGPEVCKHTDLSPTRDIYAFTVVIYKLLTEKFPYGNKKEIICNRDDFFPDKPEQLDDKTWECLRRGLEYNWKKRPDNIQLFWNEVVDTWVHQHELTYLPEINNRTPTELKKRQLTIAIAVSKPTFFRDDIDRRLPEMVIIPGGLFEPSCFDILEDDSSFDVLATAQEVAHFSLGRYPITVAEFQLFLDDSGYEYNVKINNQDYLPITNVNWLDTAAYVEWLSEKTKQKYRLPTETEWEYACRAGTTTDYFYGNSIGDNQALFFNRYLQNVGGYAPNTFGLHDMHGTVWEWTCSDSRNPSNDIGKQVIRGGAWDVNKEKLRSSYRMEYRVSERYQNIGFRVARDM